MEKFKIVDKDETQMGVTGMCPEPNTDSEQDSKKIKLKWSEPELISMQGQNLKRIYGEYKDLVVAIIIVDVIAQTTLTSLMPHLNAAPVPTNMTLDQAKNMLETNFNGFVNIIQAIQQK